MLDKIEVTFKAGNGGDGIVSFRREAYVPMGGPDGGDGGSGGNVRLLADSGTTDFRLLRHKGQYKASDGKKGGSNKKRGKNGEDLVMTLPVGTVVLRKTETGAREAIADLEKDRQSVVVARGGKGGLGNSHYATSTRQAPEIAQKGETGEEVSVILDLRLIADVGVIGYPNVGKSSLLAVASAAKPKIADYPFTTKEPVLGVVNVGDESFVLAEIPGLISGAHLGRGLGHDFLQHALRTRMFIHLIDGSSASPVEDMIAVNNELSLFDSELGQKPQIVVVNKVDIPEVKDRVPEIEKAFEQAGISDVFFISAATGEGVHELIAETWRRLEPLLTAGGGKKEALKVFQPQPRGANLTVRKEDGTFIIEAPGLDRLVSGTGDVTPELLTHVKERLLKAGLEKLLQKAGVKPGDKIRCGYVEWEWTPRESSNH